MEPERRELAQVTASTMRAPLEDPVMRGFVEVFDQVSREADQSPGFRWRLHEPGGHAVVATVGGASQVVTLTVWRDYASLHGYVYRSDHGRVLLRRRDWFGPTRQPSTALWWVRAGQRPDLDAALARLTHLRRHGPTPQAFGLRHRFDAEGRREGRRLP